MARFWQREAIAGLLHAIGSRNDVKRQFEIVSRTRERPEHREWNSGSFRRVRRARAAHRYDAEARLVTKQSAKRRGHANRTGEIRTEFERDHAAGDGGSTCRRSARRARDIVGIVG